MDSSISSATPVCSIGPFRQQLVEHIGLLGYTVIVLSYIKFGGSIVVFLFRLLLQSALLSPFPNRQQLVLRFGGASGRTEGEDEQTPGRGARGAEAEAEDMTKEFLQRIQCALFHAAFTFNCLALVTWIIWPADFQELLGMYRYEGYPGPANTPLPLDNYVMQGEWHGKWFFQLIGEAVPASNIGGNLMAVTYQLLILCLQFGLYMLSCVYFSPLTKTQLPGYDGSGCTQPAGEGRINVAHINPVEVFRVIHGTTAHFRQGAGARNASPTSMV
ncbi:ADR030Wp [Eremothecium gossypii ATCC 10895]|uniref:ADR030Wp n=1 Tax=Eremothecium gossypii (strain ATCC 10895 / CBS 109.51 / FGSC 9923 / NRRL Y-1056) TaxID=284811 RepID=Q75A88_EREGS|nr:ADR030Wp [Eremothecium gossypii ATCC 10895]AAS51950.2 ADR030Wp [Eremothecium gossypii ATCC 10895]AEY96250.1 FADR030Wp [Eremothecium gossypii FDAG1]